jgi:predicted alpha/beta superfamily hydrolase
MVSRKSEPEVRLQNYWFNSPEFLGLDVQELKPGQPVVMDGETLGYPFRSLKEVPPGDYYVQASLIVYHKYPRADGHVVLALDQWNGHRFNASPGTLYSAVQKIHLDSSQIQTVRLNMNQVVLPSASPADTEWVRYVKIQSKLLSQFWGRPIYLGATVLLPRDYASHPEIKYPVIYQQQAHFNLLAPFDFSAEDLAEGRERYERECRGACETGYQFYQSWRAGRFPRMIAVALQHPTPYADYSAASNSANNGPYGDAIVKELIPYIEQQFRIIREPYARLIVGKSMGGRDALAQQLKYPEFFGGAWIFYPWGISFEQYATLNIYERDNAFEIRTPEASVWNGFWSGAEWAPLERYIGRTADGQPLVTFRQLSHHDVVVDSRTGGEFGAEDANFGPVGAQGYPEPLWNRMTGTIDREVAHHWREHGDLVAYAAKNWSRIGPQLTGKLYFYVGEMDEYYRQRGVHHLEELLKKTGSDYRASFEYGPLNGHGWQPMSNAELVRIMAAHVIQNSPVDATMAWRNLDGN